MIISRTPFRISFFGGGTDYPSWYREHGGQVLATTIDKYAYISARWLPPFFNHKSRIVYSKIETVQRTDEIDHPSVKAVLNYLNINRGVEIHYDGDLPARSGVGSSSSFTVGLINALMALEGKHITRESLAQEALHIEQDIIRENVGSQDQICAAFGGFNKIQFHSNGTFDVTPIILDRGKMQEFKSHLMLFFTGFQRIASTIAKAKIDNFKNRVSELNKMHFMVDEAIKLLSSGYLDDFGKLLHESWMYKRSLAQQVSTSQIDEMYDIARNAGATGGKLLGAGGGGFLLVFAKPEYQEKIRESLKHLLHVPFNFEISGSKIALYQPNGF